MKNSFVIHTDIESLFEKSLGCNINPEESSKAKVIKYLVFGYALFTHCSFDSSRSKNDIYRGADCVKKFCADSKKHKTEVTNYEK